ncbi:unnamed protein product [Commensalibacter communis]|uniref:hypothetical protein n=1 Tax=Commensalibacter communis TaxID=2972786 RepID=UPI0022FF800F|nr:hypothetical protein [Commensalibacter communis]CAI3927768.1 unnamed protein product [Commensalibacter communis]
MKKQLFALTIIASLLPIAANADTPKMPQKALQESIDKYGAIYCKEGLNAMKDAVKKCYEDTAETSPELDKCIVADMAMASIAVRREMKYEKSHGAFQKNPRESDPYYNSETAWPRIEYYLSAPRFKKDPSLNKLDDFDLQLYFPRFPSLPGLFATRCPSTY